MDLKEVNFMFHIDHNFFPFRLEKDLSLLILNEIGFLIISATKIIL